MIPVLPNPSLSISISTPLLTSEIRDYYFPVPLLGNLLPGPEQVLALEPEQIAPMLLKFLSTSDGSGYLNLYTLILEGNIDRLFGQSFEPQQREQLAEQLALAWNWLMMQGLIIRKSGDTTGWHRLTRRGQQLAQSENIRQEFGQTKMLPRRLLHPTVDSAVWPDFVRGDYDSAVFKAFKEVEVAVRTAADLADSDIGVPLMRKAFDEATGPLTDPNALGAEKQALSHLFAGAIGSYKNPSSHRRVRIGPQEAAEMIVLASHLLKIVEDRIELLARSR